MKPVHYDWEDYVRKPKPLWQRDEFWVVLLPSALVAVVFAVAWVFRWVG